ncbi:MAG TPA: hypothetical protein VFS31_05940 [Chitinophagaceae bacterium]|nr:hypothetical protein [Chitinophagaceae bacterium]
MKTVLISLCLMFAAALANGQSYDDIVLTYNFNGTPVNGIKIKTNMPFTNGTQMPTLIIEGYNHGGSSPIGLLLTYYIYNGAFVNAGVSSYGAYNPPVYLANEGGKVAIFINSKDYYLRMTVRAFAKGFSAETATNFQGWTTADEALSGTAQSLVPYRNRFAGDVYFQDGVWNKDGNVGIGTITPGAKLEAAGDIQGTGVFMSNTNIGTGGFILASAEKKPRWIIRGLNAETGAGNTGYDLDIIRRDDAGNGIGTALYIKRSNGNIGIGTADPGNYKLAVEGTIGARKVKVTQTSWADFVFDSGYSVPALKDVEAYIHVNHHLPDMPGAAEVQDQGLDVGEMNKKLLQKIEELTLYLIEQQKMISALQAKDAVQEAKIQALENK